MPSRQEREPDTAEAREAELAEEVEEADAAVDAEVEADEVAEEQAEEQAGGAGRGAGRGNRRHRACRRGRRRRRGRHRGPRGGRGLDDAIAADLEKARAEAESYLDDLRRLQADFDNYRKRTLREQTARAASASQALVARLLPVLDNFELAVSSAEHSRDFDRMLKGVEMVFGELREVMEGEGLVAEGKPFDPERHEAVIAVEQEDTEPGMVVDIVRTGYELRARCCAPPW